MKRHPNQPARAGTFLFLLAAAGLFLSGCSKRAGEFTFIQVCDPQIRVGPDDSAFRAEGTVERFEAAARQINALNPDFVIVCGDLVQRSGGESFAAYRDLRDRIAVPCYTAPGNHDFNPSRGDERPTPERLRLYREFFGNDYFAFVHEGRAFVFLNTPLYLAKEGGDHWRVEPFEGVIEEEYDKQDAWLRRTLAGYATRGLPIFLIGHHPLHPDMPGLAPGVLPVPLRRDLFRLFQETGVGAVLGGHGHRVFIREYEGIPFVHAHTTSFLLEPDPEKRDDFGFRCWRVHADGTYTHEFIPLEDSTGSDAPESRSDGQASDSSVRRQK